MNAYGRGVEQLDCRQVYGKMGELVPSRFCHGPGDPFREALSPRNDVRRVSRLGPQFGAEKKADAGAGLQSRAGLVIDVILSVSGHRGIM